MGGIAEADELFLLESQKGSRTLGRPARKRGGVARWRGINRDHVASRYLPNYLGWRWALGGFNTQR